MGLDALLLVRRLVKVEKIGNQLLGIVMSSGIIFTEGEEGEEGHLVFLRKSL